MSSKNVNYKNCATKMTLPHYTSSQNSVISVGYVDSYAKIFLILYLPSLKNSTTRITILVVVSLLHQLLFLQLKAWQVPPLPLHFHRLEIRASQMVTKWSANLVGYATMISDSYLLDGQTHLDLHPQGLQNPNP